MLPDVLTLYTVQPPVIADDLAAGRTVRCREHLAMPNTMRDEHGLDLGFTEAYDWIATQLDRRDPRPPGGPRWPMWAWWSPPDREHDAPHRPDMRRFGFRQTEPAALIQLQVAARRALLTDLDRWTDVLNRVPAKGNINRYYDQLDATEPGSLERRQLDREMKRSWRACLAVHPARGVQAVLWEFRPHDVVRVWRLAGYAARK